MKKFKIRKYKLVGSQLENFPLQVLQVMIEEQIKQGNDPDYEVFLYDLNTNKLEGGFDWESTEQGYSFWYEVIHGRNFDLFFEKLYLLDHKVIRIVHPIKYKTSKYKFLWGLLKATITKKTARLISWIDKKGEVLYCHHNPTIIDEYEIGSNNLF